MQFFASSTNTNSASLIAVFVFIWRKDTTKILLLSEMPGKSLPSAPILTIQGVIGHGKLNKTGKILKNAGLFGYPKRLEYLCGKKYGIQNQTS